ncbi:MAG: hypothetical protein JWN77_236 [Frankiales bacterium]|jgi:hypothetical protein|nr:hypothetical protein [Frankiales bacterium]
MNEPETRLRRGLPPAHVPPVPLHAGELRAELAGTDIRSVTWRGHEVVQRLYMAVRDAPWNTIPGVLLEREVTQRSDSFVVSWRQQHAFGEMDLIWQGRVEGTADGELSYVMDAVCQTAFRHSKIGLNVHHGLGEYRGRPYRAATNKGDVRGELPGPIQPQLVEAGSLTAMFDHFDAIDFDLDGLTARFRFDGDRFEMQDHRNWADANFKTYGTPLSFGFPMDAAAGDRLYQRVSLRVEGDPPPRVRDTAVRFAPRPSENRLPQVGHRLTSAGEPAAGVLRVANPKHLRLDVAADAGIAQRLADARAVTGGRTPLELAVLVDPAAPELAAGHVASALADGCGDIARVVVLARAIGFSEFGGAAPPELARAVASALRARGIDLPVFSGTSQFFTELNRARPDYAGLAGVGFSLNPQVHASDDRSVMDNVESIPDIAASARLLYPVARICIAPVHLLGPNGPFPSGPTAPGGGDPALDLRHGALFGAAWTVALLEAAARAKIEFLTLYDLVGPRGLAPGDPADSVAVPSAAAAGYPLLWPVRRWAELQGADPAVAWLPDVPDRRCALVGYRSDGLTRFLLANRQAEPTDVRLQLPGDAATVTVLDEATLETTDLLTSAGPPSADVQLDAGRLTVMLRPYAVACVDVPTPGSASPL